MQVLNSDFEPGDGGGVGQGDLLEGAGYHCHRSGHKCYSRYLDQVQYFFQNILKTKSKSVEDEKVLFILFFVV